MELNKTNVHEWTYGMLYIKYKDGKIKHDTAFNRIQAGAWDIKRKHKFIVSAYDRRVHSLIVLVHVDSCLAHGKNINNTESIEYFSKLQRDGFEYVILDGSNRIGCINEYINSVFDIANNKSIIDSDRTIIRGSYVPVSIVTNSTKKQLHEDAINLNSGESWNKQEKRQALDKEIAIHIREIANGIYKEGVGCKIDTINVKRLDDQLIIANTFHYLQYGGFGKQKDFDRLYSLAESSIKKGTYTQHKFISSKLFDMFKSKTSMKFSKSFFAYMFAVLEQIDKDGYEVSDVHKMNFFNGMADYWEELRNDKTTMYYSPQKEQSYTWKNLMGFLELELNQKLSVLMAHVYGKLNLCLSNKINNKRIIDTSTSSKVRYDIATRDKCMVRINGKINNEWYNPHNLTEYQEFKLHEIMLSSDLHVDHIVPLNGVYIKGEDSIDNMEMAEKDYNGWKNNKQTIPV
jgi:hypothetical protein